MLRGMHRIEEQVALVTGASRGVGAAVALLLARRGSDIVLNFRSKLSRAEGVAAEIRQAGRRVLLAQADITSEQDVQGMAARIAREFGRLDLLVLNASGGSSAIKPRATPCSSTSRPSCAWSTPCWG